MEVLLLCFTYQNQMFREQLHRLAKHHSMQRTSAQNDRQKDPFWSVGHSADSNLQPIMHHSVEGMEQRIKEAFDLVAKVYLCLLRPDLQSF